MNSTEAGPRAGDAYAVELSVEAAIADRNRLTTLFRAILAIPHILLVGGPLAAVLSWTWNSQEGQGYEFGAGGGVLGVVAVACAIIAWFAIVFTGRHPAGLRQLTLFYLRWRVRAVAYLVLLRDEYPPFGEGAYPTRLLVHEPATRHRLTVAFRLILIIPHLIAVWVLGIAWLFVTVFAWFAILFTGRYPPGLYGFSVGVLRWNTRVEAYMLLLQDAYPPFSLNE